ncbi:uncharacterized protein LOC120343094 [Styela clava]
MGICEVSYEEPKNSVVHGSAQCYQSNNLMKEYRDVFNFYDVKKTGRIELNDFIEILDRVGLDSSIEKITEVAKNMAILECDRPLLDKISFEEFVSLMISLDPVNWIRDEEMHLVFQRFDTDADGFISGNDLRKLLTSLGENIDDNELQAMMSEADRDGDGKVNYNEFIRVMTNTSNKTCEKSKNMTNNKSHVTEAKIESTSHTLSPSRKNKSQVNEDKHNSKQRRRSRLLQIQEQVSRIRMQIAVRRILNKGSWN